MQARRINKFPSMRSISPYIAALCCIARAGIAWACIDEFPQPREYHVIGKAYDASGAFIYTEHLGYSPGPTGGTMITLYRNAQGQDIATRRISYDCRPTAPGFEMHDLINDVKEGVRWTGKRIQSYQGEDIVTLDVPPGESVFDAGFDNSIRIHWASLIEGKALKFNYLFARKNKFLKLRLERTSAPKSLKSENAENMAFFRIRANNPFLRLLSRPIYVGYDIATRSLRYYSGPSNLPMASGVGDVLIRYQITE